MKKTKYRRDKRRTSGSKRGRRFLFDDNKAYEAVAARLERRNKLRRRKKRLRIAGCIVVAAAAAIGIGIGFYGEELQNLSVSSRLRLRRW